MGAVFWLVAAAAGVGGYFAFRRLQDMEREIRDEIEARQREVNPPAAAASSPVAEPAVVPAPPGEPARAQATEPAREAVAEKREEPTVEGRLLLKIRQRPGRLQTELYAELADVDRKQLQEVLLRLDRAGRIRRVKERSTYRVFPV